MGGRQPLGSVGWRPAVGLKIYCDTGDDETRVLASGGRNEGDESDRAFLELFAESAGGHFGIEMAGGAPRSVRSPMDREFLRDRFVDLFEVTGSEDSLRAQLRAARRTPNRHLPAAGTSGQTSRSGSPPRCGAVRSVLLGKPDRAPGPVAGALVFHRSRHAVLLDVAGERAADRSCLPRRP